MHPLLHLISMYGLPYNFSFLFLPIFNANRAHRAALF